MWGAQSYLSPPNRCSHITSICGGPREVGSLGVLHQESEHLFHCLGQASTATVGLLLDLDRQFCSCKSEQIKDGKLRSRMANWSLILVELLPLTLSVLVVSTQTPSLLGLCPFLPLHALFSTSLLITFTQHWHGASSEAAGNGFDDSSPIRRLRII